MSLEFVYIESNPVPELEFVEMNAIKDIEDISKYKLIHRPSGLTFLFYPTKNNSIKTGDRLILYTGKGDDMEYHNNISSMSHRYYWGLNESLWLTKTEAVIIDDTGVIEIRPIRIL